MKTKLPKFSGTLVLIFVLIAIGAPWIANESHRGHILPIIKWGPEQLDTIVLNTSPPSSAHIFGTDYIGRDIFSRLVHGIKNSLFFSFFVVFFCLFFGVIIGGIMGFFGGKIDLIVSRIIEVIGNFPIFLLQLTLLAFFNQNYGILFFVMVIVGWIPYARFARAEFFRLRNLEFVQAAIALGASRRRIFFKHLLPNSLTPIVIYAPFDLSSTIVVLGALSFLGFGEPINVASLGELLKQAKDHFQEAWWLALFPATTLFLLTLSLTIFGSGIRDYLDPRQAK